MSDVRRFLRAEWDRVAGYGCIVAGVVLLTAGIFGVRSAADVIDEISYLVTGGIGSIFLLGVGATLLLSADIHDDFRKLHRVEQKLDRVERLLLAQHPELLDVTDPPAAGTETAVPLPGREQRPPVAAGTRAALAVRRGRLFATIGIAVAAVLFGAGALRTADQPTTDHMAGSVGVALGGALLVAFVAVVLVAQLRASVEQRKLAVFGGWLAGEPGGAALAGDIVADPASAVFTVAGVALYHRAGCQLLDGRTVVPTDRAALLAGTVACRLCEPA